MNRVKDIPGLSQTVVKADMCTPAGMTHRSCRRPTQQTRDQTAESLRCAAACPSRSTLTVTQPLVSALQRSWLTPGCESQRLLKPPSWKTKKNENIAQLMFQKTLPLIILKGHDYYYLTSSALALTGSKRKIPHCRDENQMLCVHLDSCRSWRGDTFSLSLTLCKLAQTRAQCYPVVKKTWRVNAANIVHLNAAHTQCIDWLCIIDALGPIAILLNCCNVSTFILKGFIIGTEVQCYRPPNVIGHWRHEELTKTGKLVKTGKIYKNIFLKMSPKFKTK